MRSCRVFFILSPVLLALVIVSVGCGDGGGGPKFTDRESGVSMRLPPGWRKGQGGTFYESAMRNDPFGMVTIHQLEGKSVEEYVKELIGSTASMEKGMQSLLGALDKPTGGQASSEIKEAKAGLQTETSPVTPITIGGHAAFEIVGRSTQFATYEVWFEKNGRGIQVFYRCYPDDWAKYEPLFRASAQTIELK